jgi:hypothetical protein
MANVPNQFTQRRFVSRDQAHLDVGSEQPANQQEKQIGARAVELITSLFQNGERGLPPHPAAPVD